MAETTIDDIVTTISRRYDRFARCTAAAGSSASTIVSTDLTDADNAFRNFFVRATSGTYSGAERLITAYAIGRLTCNPFAGSIATGVTFDVKALKHVDITDAVVTAIRSAGDAWMAQKVDETNTFNDSTQMYDLPSDLVTLLSVDLKTDSANTGFYEWTPIVDYDIVGAPGERKLRMRGGWTTTEINTTPTVYTVRYHYLALPSKATTSTSALGYGENAEDQAINFIVEYALHLLHEQAFSRDRLADDARAHLTLSQQHKMKADEMKRWANMRVSTHRYTGPTLPRHI